LPTNEGTPEWDLEDTTAIWERNVEERRRKLEAELEVNARLNTGLAQAAGLTRSKLPPKLAREMEQIIERTFNVDPPPISAD